MWYPKQLDGKYTLVTGHPTLSLLAAVFEGGVCIIDDDLATLQTSPAKKDATVQKLKWHPTRKFVAIGWSTGLVAIWCPDTDSSLREGIAHHGSIAALEWNPFGTRVVTGDEEGGLVVWKVDTRGKLASLSRYRLHSAVQHIVFKHISTRRDSKGKREESPAFFVTNSNDKVFFADDMGHCTESIQLDTKVHLLQYNESKDVLLVLGADLTLSHYNQTTDGKLVIEPTWMRVKLAATAHIQSLVSEWIDSNTLIYSENGSAPKLWDAMKEETIVLSRPDLEGLVMTSFSFSKRNEILATASESGVVILWQRYINGTETSWEPLTKVDLSSMCSNLSWFANDNMLLVQTNNGIQTVSEQVLLVGGFGDKTFIYPTGVQRLAIERGGATIFFDTPHKVKGLQVGPNAFLVWYGNSTEIFVFENNVVKSLATFTSTQPIFSIGDTYAFVAANNCVNFINLKTLEGSSMLLPFSEGDVLSISSRGNKLHIMTTSFQLSTFEMNGRESRLASSMTLSKVFNDSTQAFLSKSNCTGEAIVMIGMNESSTIHIIHPNTQKIASYDCGSMVKRVEWDVNDSRVLMLCCRPSDHSKEQAQLLTFYITSEQIVFKDSQELPDNCEALVSVQIPNIHYTRKLSFNTEKENFFASKKLKEYEGIDASDYQVVRTVTDFCYYLTMGDIDKVIKLVKLIKNDAIWMNLAQVCIKMRRVKLAKLCFGKLKNAKALRTISHFCNESNQNNLCAHLAIHMGMYEEAKEIWNETKNYTELSQFYQRSGNWSEAIDISATKDRASLPLTYFKFAKYLLAQGDKAGAIAALEKSNASKSEIPRMMMENLKELASYVEKSTDKDIKKWWAQNAESHGDVETAVRHYEQIGDIFSLVRVHCLSGNLKAALELADLHQNNLAAQYFIARHFESVQQWNNAISYYTRSKCFGSAIRIAKEQKIEKELMQLALQSSPTHMVEVARYFEKQSAFDKSIALYTKAGSTKKAMDLCFKSNNIKLLESIVETLDPEKDTESFQKASLYLSKNGSPESALYLLITGRRYTEVFCIHQILELCEKGEVQISEEMAQKILESENVPKETFLRLGEICLQNGHYHLSCKAFAMGGDRLKAMGSLLKSGDKDKIIVFANVSKNPDVFTLAANYLQTLNWSNDTTTMRTIIQFYTKAKAFQSLSRFYETCAQIEIDEYQNYEKALAALGEAEKALERDKYASLDMLKYKQKIIALFLEAHRFAEQKQVDHCEAICVELLNENEIDSIIRIGDIFGLLIETNFKCGDRDKASELLQRLQMRLPRNVTVEYYVNEDICKALSPQSAAEEEIEEEL